MSPYNMIVFLVYFFLQSELPLSSRLTNQKAAKLKSLSRMRGSNESSLAKFLREPQLGKSWYDPAGPTPTFFKNQRNGSHYISR
jgi:hypothetical protein